ncbi:unnamed protein product [Diatraea saccharalis]|uniref:BEN domain-containing protein n=1 Tax=Diatraea saccharalis TaxID=40085 RepID=A0A9N9R8X6_9NEOP|nr:unnamed protein product [Diatraea saccharalis]
MKFLPQNNALDRIHYVPSTWIQWQSKECETVLAAYPDEPWEVTEKRAKVYEDPRADWNLSLAQVKDISDDVYEIIKEKKHPGVLKSSTGQRSVNIDKILQGIRISYLRMNQILTSLETLTVLEQEINDLRRISRNFPKNWTLKHREYSPGLVKLVKDTGVYIGKIELEDCLDSSTKCTQLARLLTKNIFSESALKHCLYVGSVNNKTQFRLDSHATTVISTFVLSYGCSKSWNHSSDQAVKNAMRYMLAVYKKTH